MALRLPNDKIKEFVVDSGLVSADAFQSVLEEAKRSGQEVIDLLISRGFITEDYALQLFSEYFKTPVIKLRGRLIKKSILSMLPEEVARMRRAVVFDQDKNGVVYVAMEDPGDLETVNFWKNILTHPSKYFNH
jgi:GSPII_E N-terminal domain.